MHPAWLAALPLALLPWLGFLRPHTLRFSALSVAEWRWTLRRVLAAVPPLLESTIIVLVVLALARPQEVRRETVRESEGLDILLMIDTSGSMEAADMGTAGRELNRLQASQLVMSQFIEGRADDRIGLVVFGEEAFVQVPLTLDHTGLLDLIGQLEIGMAGRNATAVGTAIAVGAKRMKELDAPSKIMVLVTDGRSNAGLAPLQAAEAAAALGIRVYTIGVGSVGGRGMLGMLGGGGADVDEPTLRGVASRTGGRYYRATDTSALAAVYAEIDALEKSTAKVKEFIHRDELYLYPLLPAIPLLMLNLLLSATFLRRLP